MVVLNLALRPLRRFRAFNLVFKLRHTLLFVRIGQLQ